MNNEPVAWMQIHYKDNKPTKYSSVKTWEDDVPLYTHPAKTLTDEEIWDWFKENTALEKQSALKIAKAILRKAQEK